MENHCDWSSESGSCSASEELLFLFYVVFVCRVLKGCGVDVIIEHADCQGQSPFSFQCTPLPFHLAFIFSPLSVMHTPPHPCSPSSLPLSRSLCCVTTSSVFDSRLKQIHRLRPSFLLPEGLECFRPLQYLLPLPTHCDLQPKPPAHTHQTLRPLAAIHLPHYRTAPLKLLNILRPQTFGPRTQLF